MIYGASSKAPLKPLIDFSNKAYGKHAYQASPNFLNWALAHTYLEISTTNAKSGEVYSMIHSMRIDNGQHYFKSFFNYISNQDQRAAGIQHLASIRRAKSFFIPAVSDQGLSASYERFGAAKISFNWYQRLILPLPNLPLILKILQNKNISILDKRNDISITNRLSSVQLAMISEMSGITDIKFINWRLMSKNNNRVFILEDNNERALVIAIIGKRRHVPLVRIISCFGSSSTVKKLVDRACHLGCELGAVICLPTIHEKHTKDFISDDRYKLRNGINTYYKAPSLQNEEGLIKPECLMLCGDLGFAEQFGG